MPTAGNAPPRPGARRIAGRYLLTEALGSGAMGVVWSGFDEVLRREVAVKELTVPPGVPPADRADLRERMLREARTLGGLSHPNVITVYDVVEERGEPFVVLELLVSRSLSEVVTDRGRLGWAEVAAVGVAIAAALRSVHRAGITHRDVKPGNVLVAGDGRIKLTDFGIARNVNDATITTTGLVLGSPAYMAPEVAAGGTVTPAADLWGLGATLFAAVEGRPPYDASDAIATITEVVVGPVPRTSMGGPVGEVIAGLMRKEPGARMPLADVLRRLSPLLPDPTLPRFPLRGRSAAVPAPRAAGIQVPVPRTGHEPRAASHQVRAAASGAPPAADPGPQPAGAPLAAAPGRLPAGAPLAADPGPLPVDAVTEPSRRPAGRGRSVRTLASAVLVVLVVLVGVAGGWTLTRMLAGQSPLAGPPPTGPTEAPAPGVELIPHADPAGFTVPVPPGWPAVAGRSGNPAANPVVRFTSQDGAAALTIDRLNGNRTDPEGFAATLTARRLGVDRVTVEDPLDAVPEGQFELRYRTYSADGQRLVWARIVPRGADLWVLRLSAPPGGRDPDPAALFGQIADGFRPT